MSLYIVINLLFSLLSYKYSDFFFIKMCLLIKKRKKAPSIASITLFKSITHFAIGLHQDWAAPQNELPLTTKPKA